MKILFADAFPADHFAAAVARGHECALKAELTAETLPEAIAGYQALVVRSTRVTAETFARADALKLVVRAGAGTNTIDKDTAAGRGICVCNVPGRNAIAVAELTLGLLLAIDRRIPDAVADLRAGKWDKKRYSTGLGLYGRCIGIVGMGAIGVAVAERATAFGMRVKTLDKPDRAAPIAARLAALGVELIAELADLAATCDVLSFHVPATPGTRGLLGRELLARMRPGSIVLNTSRGEVVDEAALLAALDEKGIRAGLDVYAGEPGTPRGVFDSPLARHPNVYGTHHVGASTRQAQNAVAEGTLEVIDAFNDGTVLNCVNGVA